MSFQLLPSIGKDPAIKDVSKASIPGHPPEGFVPLSNNEITPEISNAAKQILHSSQLGDQVPFIIDGQKFMGRHEPHYHPIPPEGADTSKYPKPWGWHQGITVFRSKDNAEVQPSENYQPQTSMVGRQQIMRRLLQAPDPMEQINRFLSDFEK